MLAWFSDISALYKMGADDMVTGECEGIGRVWLVIVVGVVGTEIPEVMIEDGTI